jgi:5-methylthioadenosine/S-adenosylhomocysteine deaminase
VLAMATTSGSRILGLTDAPAGIVAGAPADLVVVRRDNAANAMAEATVGGFISQAGRDAVEAVMIDGRWVLRDDRILTFDEAGMLADVAHAHTRIAERTAVTLPEIDRALRDVALQFAPWQRP